MATQIVEIPTTIQAPPPAVFLTELAFGMKMTQALYVTAKLGIADLLCAGPRHVSQLAAATETSERSLYRVLRSLAAVGIFRETDPKVFELTPHAEALRSDVPNSFRNGANVVRRSSSVGIIVIHGRCATSSHTRPMH